MLELKPSKGEQVIQPNEADNKLICLNWNSQDYAIFWINSFLVACVLGINFQDFSDQAGPSCFCHSYIEIDFIAL